jgi:putative ABC transport system ATP-binding protein
MATFDDGRRTPEPLIRVQNVTKTYGTLHALDRVSFEIQSGEWVAVMGPSGSGKTTLLNLLGAMDHPSSGEIVVAGVALHDLDQKEATVFRREHIGFVFQQFHMVPYLNALENVMLAQYFHSMADEEEAAAALRRVGLGDRLNHLPCELSGGEQQRVCIARALINEPELILADEPTGNLDEANERIVMGLFEELHRNGHTILMVTHDPAIGSKADRQLFLEHGRLVRQERRGEGLRDEVEEVVAGVPE